MLGSSAVMNLIIKLSLQDRPSIGLDLIMHLVNQSKLVSSYTHKSMRSSIQIKLLPLCTNWIQGCSCAIRKGKSEETTQFMRKKKSDGTTV